MNEKVKNFFANCDSDGLDRAVLRPLSHILPNWELTWDNATQKYEEEDGSFSAMLNTLIDEFSQTTPPAKYHDNEDRLAEYVKNTLHWPIEKRGNAWWYNGKRMKSYDSLLEQGGFSDADQADLVKAATGRIHAAIKRNQLHFDDMEESHQAVLASVMAVILYHRSSELPF